MRSAGTLIGYVVLAVRLAEPSAEALGADASLALPEVTVTARPVTPEWKKWNPYGGSTRVEEDKWPDIPCSASRIAAGTATGCKTGPLVTHTGVGLPSNDRSPDWSNCKMSHDLVMTTLGNLAVEADVIVVDPYFVSAIRSTRAAPPSPAMAICARNSRT